MTVHLLVLLPSPLLGPAVWAPVADLLRSRGHKAAVPSLPPMIATPDDVIAGWLREIPADRDLLLVPHSNAGLYVAALAEARSVRGIVFVDAGLPSAQTTTPTAPPAFRRFLGGLVDHEGLLPPWTQWWEPADVAALLPDPMTRAAVEGDQRRLPLSYFDADVPSPPGWEAMPAAYLAFGDTYADERSSAKRRGWPVRTLPGEHLHVLADPEAVTDALLGLIGRIRGCESFPVD
ncbi:MAG TPA: hypothetical protein VM688_06195 [Nocardioidaceae bacterium]|nr:hypothetical protein [Nocardioidaceae bacterium]